MGVACIVMPVRIRYANGIMQASAATPARDPRASYSGLNREFTVVRKLTLTLLALVLLSTLATVGAQAGQNRIALVLGNAAYADGSRATAATDAALIASALQAAGFDVVGARDLDEEALRRALRDFVDRAAQAGPDAIIVIYFAGIGLQFEGENYLVPVDAHLARTSDLRIQAVRVSDVVGSLAGVPSRGRIVILDAAYEIPLAGVLPPLAPGLTAVQPEPETLIAFNAAPGTVAPGPLAGPGPYALALSESLGTPGLAPQDIFERVRLRAAELGGGVQAWQESRLTLATLAAPAAVVASGVSVARKPAKVAPGVRRHVRHARPASPLAVIRARLRSFGHALSRAFHP
jgi:hypothetical protein